MKVILLYGGKSPEHEISKLSAFSILQEIYYNYYEVQLVYIQKDGTFIKGPLLNNPPETMEELELTKGPELALGELYEKDAIVFPCLHGPNGEDGTIQGLLEVLKMPYVGCGVLASATSMDKIMTKMILQQVGIPQIPFVAVTQRSWKENPRLTFEQCEGMLLYPMFVKPANLGSSVGISKVANREELQAALQIAFSYGDRVIVEQGVEAREIEVGLLGNKEVRTTMAGEIIKTIPFYNYEEKYENEGLQFTAPADISPELHEKAQEYAKTAFLTLNGTGLARCDFFLTSNGELFLNELNTMPGFTKRSMYPLLWEERGLQMKDLIEELIQLGLKNFKNQTNEVLLEDNGD